MRAKPSWISRSGLAFSVGYSRGRSHDGFIEPREMRRSKVAAGCMVVLDRFWVNDRCRDIGRRSYQRGTP
jgi:hypothetical protein